MRSIAPVCHKPAYRWSETFTERLGDVLMPYCLGGFSAADFKYAIEIANEADVLAWRTIQ